MTETIYYTVLNYVQDVGAYLSVFFYLFWMVATVIGSMLVVQYIKQLKSLIQRKYREAYYMSKMKNYLEKFRKIHTALLERRDDPEY